MRERRELRDSIFKKVRARMDAEPNVDHVLDRIGEIGIGRVNDRPSYSSKLIETIAANFNDAGRMDDMDFWKQNLTDDDNLA